MYVSELGWRSIVVSTGTCSSISMHDTIWKDASLSWSYQEVLLFFEIYWVEEEIYSLTNSPW